MSAMLGRSGSKWQLAARWTSHEDDTYARNRRQARAREKRTWKSRVQDDQ